MFVVVFHRGFDKTRAGLIGLVRFVECTKELESVLHFGKGLLSEKYSDVEEEELHNKNPPTPLLWQ